MPRLVAFFVFVLVLLLALRGIPLLGILFRVPILGFLLAIAIAGFLVERAARALVQRRRSQRMRRELGAVETPHNRGKLGALFLAERRYRKAIPHLAAAVEGEPASTEWRYRLGCALLGARYPEDAAEELAKAAQADPEHAYGAVLLRLAEARQAAGDPRGSLEALEQYEAARGPTPESAYRSGLAHKALGEKALARASFDEVFRSASRAARYQKGEARGWLLRATLARLHRPRSKAERERAVQGTRRRKA